MDKNRAGRRGRPARTNPDRKKERVPLGVPRMKLSYDDIDPNYVYRMIHNRPNRANRVNDALEAGYEFVYKKSHDDHTGEADVTNESASSLDTRITHVVGTDDASKPLIGYLMKIKKEWYEADQAAKQAPIDDLEQAMLSGEAFTSMGDSSTMYAKKGTMIKQI